MKLAIVHPSYPEEKDRSMGDNILDAAQKHDISGQILHLGEEKDVEHIKAGDSLKDLLWVVFNGNFDIFYVYNSYWPNFVMPLLASLFGKEVIYSPHCAGFHKLQKDWKNWIKRKLIFLFQDSTYIRCLSRWERQKFESEGFDNERIFYAPYNINYEEFSKIDPARKGRQVFSLANVRRFKNVESQIQAIAELVEEYPDIKLHMIGGWKNDDYRQEIENLVEELGVEENVEIHGFVSREEMFEIMSDCQVFIHTSEFETQGLAIYEACAAGFPSCVSDQPVHNQNFESFKHQLGDYEKLAGDIKTIFQLSNEKKKDISNDMQDLAENFSYEREMERLEEMFDQILDRDD